MSTQPIGIRVVCDSCRNHIDTGAIQTANARIVARHEGWDTTPGVPMRDICPACIEHAQRGEA